jgi:hypothetical protein
VRYFYIAALAMGCAQMPASDNPLEAVPVEVAAIDEPVVPVAPPETEPVAEPPPSETEALIEEVAEAAEAFARNTDVVADKTGKAGKRGKRKAAHRRARPAASGSVQLIGVLPDANPPRAILMLPSGQEIVVKAGQMVPDAGVVVLSIQAGRVEVIRIEPDEHGAVAENQILEVQD